MRKHFLWEIQKNGYGKSFETRKGNGFVFRIPEQSENKSEVNTEEKIKETKEGKRMSEFNYFYGSDAEQFNFFRIPKKLILDPKFRGLSNDAKILYSITPVSYTHLDVYKRQVRNM